MQRKSSEAASLRYEPNVACRLEPKLLCDMPRPRPAQRLASSCSQRNMADASSASIMAKRSFSRFTCSG
jgi:hypothetical protein